MIDERTTTTEYPQYRQMCLVLGMVGQVKTYVNMCVREVFTWTLISGVHDEIFVNPLSISHNFISSQVQLFYKCYCWRYPCYTNEFD